MHILPLVVLSSYFEKGDSDEEPDSKKGKLGDEEEEEDDPLEAFMMGIEVQEKCVCGRGGSGLGIPGASAAPPPPVNPKCEAVDGLHMAWS